MDFPTTFFPALISSSLTNELTSFPWRRFRRSWHELSFCRWAMLPCLHLFPADLVCCFVSHWSSRSGSGGGGGGGGGSRGGSGSRSRGWGTNWGGGESLLFRTQVLGRAGCSAAFRDQTALGETTGQGLGRSCSVVQRHRLCLVRRRTNN